MYVFLLQFIFIWVILNAVTRILKKRIKFSHGSSHTEKFLGDQLLSYGQNLTLNFRVDRRDTRLSAEDLVLEGADLRLAVPLIAQGNSYPGENMQTYVFRWVDDYVVSLFLKYSLSLFVRGRNIV